MENEPNDPVDPVKFRSKTADYADKLSMEIAQLLVSKDKNPAAYTGAIIALTNVLVAMTGKLVGWDQTHGVIDSAVKKAIEAIRGVDEKLTREGEA